ncbi:MAG: phosphoribosylglycinamide formyltransferase [Prevotella sp.]
MKKIAIFVSGNGSNCENIINHFAGSDSITTALVLSNREDAFALQRAARHGVPTVVMKKADFNDEAKLTAVLKQYDIDFIVLAGFLLMIPEFLVRQYHHRMINIHPSLLPKYGGKGMYGHHVHEAVKAAGDTETGISIHWVSPVCDEGEIISQFSTPVEPSDSADDIASKVHALEMEYFPETIERIINHS